MVPPGAFTTTRFARVGVGAEILGIGFTGALGFTGVLDVVLGMILDVVFGMGFLRVDFVGATGLLTGALATAFFTNALAFGLAAALALTTGFAAGFFTAFFKTALTAGFLAGALAVFDFGFGFAVAINFSPQLPTKGGLNIKFCSRPCNPLFFGCSQGVEGHTQFGNFHLSPQVDFVHHGRQGRVMNPVAVRRHHIGHINHMSNGKGAG